MKRAIRDKERPRTWMKDAFGWLFIAAATATAAWPATSVAAPVVFEAAGLTAADIQGACKRHRAHQRMLDQRRADFTARAEQHAEHAGMQTFRRDGARDDLRGNFAGSRMRRVCFDNYRAPRRER